jgi:cytochrome c-type biogenesis protein CcmH/NrfG
MEPEHKPLDLLPMDQVPPAGASAKPLDLLPMDQVSPAGTNDRPLDLLPMGQVPLDGANDSTSQPIEIVPLAQSKPSAPTKSETDSKVDRFAREAAQQYVEGHIDQALWDSAVAKAAGDSTKVAAIYLGARATALRLLDRERREQARAPRAPVRAAPSIPDFAADDDDADPGPFVTGRFARQAGHSPLVKYGLLALALVVLVAIGVGVWAFLTRDDGSDASLTEAVPRTVVKPKAAEIVKALAADNAAAAKTAADELQTKIKDLQASGSWNLLVIYTAEWTRKDPTNPAAWDQLREGYVRLHQYNDARDAALKAAELAPNNAQSWRNLGEIYVALKDSSDAVEAFGKAVALDPQDVVSLKQVGLLSARLGHLPQAKTAIDGVLALSPGDSTAACVKGALAQMPADSKDSRAIAMAIEAMETKCEGQAANSPVAGK